MMPLRVVLCVSLLFAASTVSMRVMADDGDMQNKPIAVLRVLDKQTARVEERSAKVGEAFRFGSLSILVRTCKDTPPEDRPEAAAFLEVKDVTTTGHEEAVYSGWMFASSPALAAMEHPIYDIWVTGCKSASTK